MSGNSNVTVLSFRSRAKLSVPLLHLDKGILTGWLSGSFSQPSAETFFGLQSLEPCRVPLQPSLCLRREIWKHLASEKMEKRTFVDKWPVYTVGITGSVDLFW